MPDTVVVFASMLHCNKSNTAAACVITYFKLPHAALFKSTASHVIWGIHPRGLLGTGCRYLYRHNYTTSVPEVYYETNRPDLQALYTNQLIQRDFSRQGSTDTWVRYLTRGKGHPSAH